MSVININEKSNDAGWGFYVDIENQNTNNFDNYKITKKKLFNSNLEDIYEEYEYYSSYERNINNCINDNNNNDINGDNKKSHTSKSVCSIIVTFLLTYLVFWVI